MTPTTLTPPIGSLVPPTDHLKWPLSSLSQPPSSLSQPPLLSPTTQAFGYLSVGSPKDGHPRSPSPAAPSSSPAPSSSALDSRTASATSASSAAGPSSATGTSKPGLRKKISASLEIPRKLKERIPDFAVFCATMTGLPVIREAIESVQAVQDVTTSRQKLAEFELRLSNLLITIESHEQDPRYLNPTFSAFEKHLKFMYAQVQQETQRHSNSRFESATRLIELIDEYESKFAMIVEDAMVAGVFAQQNMPLPEVYDRVIPTLKSIHKGNGLVCKENISISTADGSPPQEAPLTTLHISRIRGEYNGTPVEIKEYFGGPDDVLEMTVKALVDNYQSTGLNPHFGELYGGSFSRSSTGQLRAHLVFSPEEGQPWLQVARARKSVELLCQVAEQTIQAFEYLKLQKQMNWESIRIRPDGTLLVVPTTEGEHFLIPEEVLDPFSVPDEDIGWPLRELCELLHEATKQGIATHAIDELRSYEGPWTKIAVWRIADKIGLRVPEEEKEFGHYPPKGWQTHPGQIIRWSPDADTLEDSFERVVSMPPSGLSAYDKAHLKSFTLIHGQGYGPDFNVSYWEHPDHWFTPTEDRLWEYIALEPWEDITSIVLGYESPRLDQVQWKEWKRILKSTAKRKKLDLDELGVVVRTEGRIRIDKERVPELGTRPIYFYRKPDRRAPPREFWGFFTFNKDPTGPTGLSIQIDPVQRAHIYSDSVSPEVVERRVPYFEVQFSVVWVSMDTDWLVRVKQEKEKERQEAEARYPTIEWPEDEDSD